MRHFFFGFTVVFYIYIICFLMAGFVNWDFTVFLYMGEWEQSKRGLWLFCNVFVFLIASVHSFVGKEAVKESFREAYNETYGHK